jgi:pimeloyl-ACP methyl ester carboxylesterase
LLFGGSEGGAVAAMLAPLVPETRAVIVFSSGIGQPVGEMIRSAIPPQMAAEAPRIFAEARLRPGGGERWGGASYAWWADAVDLVPARSLLMTDAPILLVHGTADRSAPVASARATRDLLAAAGRHNFTYREYEGYSHAMVDVSGADRRSEVLADVGAWLRRLPWDRR